MIDFVKIIVYNIIYAMKAGILMENKDHVGFYIKKINDFLQIKANEYLKKYDLTFSQMHVLLFAAIHNKGKVQQKEIEQYFGLKHPTVVGLLKRMEKKKLLTIRENPDDRRSNIVVVTEKSMSIVKGMRKSIDYTDMLITRNLSESQKNDLKNLLRIIYMTTYEQFTEQEIRPEV